VLDDLTDNLDNVWPTSIPAESSRNKIKWECWYKLESKNFALQKWNEFYLCTKCSSALKKKQDYASTHNGTARILSMVSSKGPNLVEFECSEKHKWSVNIHRGYKNWCSTCIKIAKAKLKKEYCVRTNLLNKEYASKQNKLFEEAKSQYLANWEEEEVTELSNLEDIFECVLGEAKVKAKAYMRQPDASKSCSYTQALCVYKVLELDANRVKFILHRVTPDSKKVGYKKLALSLHPDKNRHPLSNEAFLKASELFNSSF